MWVQTGWGDLLTAYDGAAITHDAIGNPESDGTWTYTWEHGRQLASMTDGTDTWTYTYDADGMRTSRTDGDVTYEYVYNGGQLTRMTVGSQTLTFGYNANGSPMYIQWNNSRYFYVTNLQGDVTAIVSVNGICVVEYTYDAWGNVLSVTGLRAENLGEYNPLRYRGYIYDSETELYYLQSRYYDPELGRFLNADALVSTGQGVLGSNMFAYCNNSPICHTDSQGYASQISLSDNENILAMPWRDPMGGGGINVAVSGYIAFGALKYSSDENSRELYGLLFQIIQASSREEFEDAVYAFRTWKKQHRNGAKIVAKGIYKMTRGFGRMFNPLATQVGQVYGVFTFVHGGILVIYGEALLLIEWSENSETE